MKNNLLSKVVAMMCLLCSFSFMLAYGGVSSTSSANGEYTWTAYFDNKMFDGDQMYIYMWDAGIGGQLMGAWPGAPMTHNDDGLWEYTFTTDYDLVTPMVIFSNGDTHQSIDLEFVNNKTYIIEEILVDGIYYALLNDVDKTVVVTFKGRNAYEYMGEYSGDVVIPSTIAYRNETYSVVSIGRRTFEDCNELVSVTIPSSVKTIDYSAFFYNNALNAIVMESVTPPTIYESSFYGVDRSVPIYVPAGSVDTYKSAPFWNEFTSIVEHGTQLYRWKATFHNTAFTGDDMYVYMWDEGQNNKEILGSWPGTVMKRLGNGVWEYSFTTTYDFVKPMIIFNNGSGGAGNQTADLTFTNGMHFENFLNIEVDNIAYTVVSKNGFGMTPSVEVVARASGLSYSGEVVIPETIVYDGETYFVDSIADYAFANSDQLTAVTIPTYIKKVGRNAFDGCTSLTKVVWNAIYADTYTEVVDGILNMYPPFLNYADRKCSVSEMIFGESVMIIPTALCANMTNLKSVTIPATVQTIGSSAFSYCTALEEVNMLANLYVIGDFAFADCMSLKDVVLPTSLRSIGMGAFLNCESFTSVNIPENVTTIGGNAFQNCTGLLSIKWDAINCSTYKDENGSIYLPFNFTDGAESNVEQVLFGDKVEYIPVGLCNMMNKLTSVVLPETVKIIDDYAFASTRLQSMVVPKSVTKLGMSAFWGCEELKQITIGDSVEEIGDYAFSRCYNLESVVIPNSVMSLGDEAFWSCTNLKSAVIGKGVTRIGNYTFSRCENLTSVTLGESVATLGDEVFWSCSSLPSITLPAALQEMGNWCFENCTSLRHVYASPLVPPTISSSTFTDAVTSVATLHTAKGYSDLYAQTLYWKDFSSIVGDFSGVKKVETDDWKLTIADGTLTISGIVDDAIVNIYSMSGTLLYSTTAGNLSTITLQHGVYLVQTNGTSRKVAI
ncbi:MAG: leucine-rich repeat protein [Bacteroidaceae bacterium]|nr:leucine-rich repeat protein [Bacteroidaceae bacterium]